jgi:hypothetical protein
MPYWIHEEGQVVGPMRAIDVLRRAHPSTPVSDGKDWFRLEDAGAGSETAVSDDQSSDLYATPTGPSLG